MMTKKMYCDNISDRIIDRLPKYYKLLQEFRAAGKVKISSKQISQTLDITASLVRFDFAHFGAFGTKGYGYDVEALIREIRGILGLGQARQMIVVGAGRIGRAVSLYQGFKKEGLIVEALFDTQPQKNLDGLDIKPMEELEEFLKNKNIDIAILAVQKEDARAVADKLYKLGIKHFWNFAPIDIILPKDAIVENIDMSESLLKLTYRINHK